MNTLTSRRPTLKGVIKVVPKIAFRKVKAVIRGIPKERRLTPEQVYQETLKYAQENAGVTDRDPGLQKASLESVWRLVGKDEW